MSLKRPDHRSYSRNFFKCGPLSRAPAIVHSANDLTAAVAARTIQCA